MDHVLANSEKPIPEPNDDEEEVAALESGDAAKVSFKANLATVIKLIWQSIKCSECGKTFRSQATASFHAEKSGHQEFEESTEEVSSSFLPVEISRADDPDQAVDGGGEEGEAPRAEGETGDQEGQAVEGG